MKTIKQIPEMVQLLLRKNKAPQSLTAVTHPVFARQALSSIRILCSRAIIVLYLDYKQRIKTMRLMEESI